MPSSSSSSSSSSRSHRRPDPPPASDVVDYGYEDSAPDMARKKNNENKSATGTHHRSCRSITRNRILSLSQRSYGSDISQPMLVPPSVGSSGCDDRNNNNNNNNNVGEVVDLAMDVFNLNDDKEKGGHDDDDDDEEEESLLSEDEVHKQQQQQQQRSESSNIDFASPSSIRRNRNRQRGSKNDTDFLSCSLRYHHDRYTKEEHYQPNPNDVLSSSNRMTTSRRRSSMKQSRE